MKKSKAGFENRGLIVLLCVLVVAIVGLGIGIVVAPNRVNKVREGEEAEFELPEELRGDDLSPGDQVIKETSLMMQDPDSSVEDVEIYYDKVVDKAISDGDTELAVEIVVQKMNFLVGESGCDKAEDYISRVDLSPYSAGERQYLASYAISMAIECDNYDLQNKWENFYSEEGDD